MTNSTYVNRVFSTRLSHPLQNVSTTTPLPTGAFPNPFVNSVQFMEVAYDDQIAQMPPPTITIPNRFPSVSDVAGNGITIEFWFKAESSGSIINLPMGINPATPTAIAPLMYIDSNGLLRAGLFDSTQIPLLTPTQNLIGSQNATGLVTVGSLNALASPLSVVDGQWHHAALVVMTPAQAGGANATQSLYLDGRLAATGKGNGNFGLSFVASDGTTWTGNTDTSTTVPLGGPISPMPATLPPSYNYLPYAQGFCGCLNEIRIWNGPRIITSIQSIMDLPASSNLSLYESEGLVGYVGSDQLGLSVQPTAYVALTADAPPFDPFTGIDRISGYQNYGIYTAIPFTTAYAPEITFQPNQTYSTKITLCQADQLQVSFPSTDSNGDDLNGTFSMSVTGASGGQISNLSQLAKGTTYTFNAPAQDCYRLDFTYTQTASINRLQFMLVPGPLNTLMQLLLDVVPLQTAYSDPDYPIAPTPNVPDPRYPGSGKTVTLNAYWPPFTDGNVFPIDPTKWSADDLLGDYLNLNEAAQAQDPTFSDFFNLSTNSSPISDVSQLPPLLDKAYFAVVGNLPSPPIPGQQPATSIDQVYTFIYNVNTMRSNLSTFLTAYAGWAQVIINAQNLNLNATPGAIANRIYNDQQNIDVNLSGPSTGDFVLNLILGSAIIGLGAVFPMAIAALTAAEAAADATVTAGTVAATAIGGAGANALSEFLGSFLGSSSARATLLPVNYTTLENLANKVSGDVGGAYNALLGNLITPSYLQTLYSNYGLLLALNGANGQPLAEANQSAILDPNNSLATGITQASWKALIPAVFTWSPQLLTGQQIKGNKTVFSVTTGSALEPPYNSKPSELGVQAVLQNDPWGGFYWMLSNVQDWQTGSASSPSGGQFFTICPIYFMWSSGLVGNQESTADWAIAWSLMDANNNVINPDLVTGLFGISKTNPPLSLADQNNPFAAAGYGWYCNTATSPAGVTTPFDAFMNWGEGMPTYSPQILVAQTFAGTLFNVQYGVFDDVQFAAAAAADTPPPALVTLEPDVLNFGSSPVGQEASLNIVLTNNQQNTLQQITSSSTDINFTTVATLQPLPSGGSETFSIIFIPRTVGELSGTITFTAQGQFGPITLTLQCTGTGVESS